MKNISPLYKFSLKGGGWDEQRQPKMQPSAEIVRVVCAKCRRECDLSCARATLRGDRARRVRKMQSESAICPARAQPCGDRTFRKELPNFVSLYRCMKHHPQVCPNTMMSDLLELLIYSVLHL